MNRRRPTYEEITGYPPGAVPTPRATEETIRESKPTIPSLPPTSWSRSMDQRSDEMAGELVVMGPRGATLSGPVAAPAPEPAPIVALPAPPMSEQMIQRAVEVVSLESRASSSMIESKLDTFLRRDEIRLALMALMLIGIVLIVILLAVRR